MRTLGRAARRPWEVESPDSGQGWVRVSMTLDDEPVGGIAARPGTGLEVAATDRAILRVLANQAAVALHNSFLFHATTQLRGRSEQLYDATTRHARDLAARSAELAETQRQLVEAMQRQALDDERHRIARELHDSVTQSVLSIGMTIEVCRAELESLGGPAQQIAERLVPAKDLTRHAAEQLRAAIYALHHTADEPPGPLPVMLQRLSTVHRPTDLHVRMMLEGIPIPLPQKSNSRCCGGLGKHCSTPRRTARPRARWSGCVTWPTRWPSACPTTGPATRHSYVGPCGCPAQRTCPDVTADWRTCWPGRRNWVARCPSVALDQVASACDWTSPCPCPGARTAMAASPRRDAVAMDETRPAVAEPASEGPVRIVLVDDHAILRQGLRSLLEREHDLQVVGEASSPGEAMAVVERTSPRIVLLDMKLSPASDNDGLSLCARLTERYPSAPGPGPLYLSGRRTGGPRHSARGARLRGQGR